MVRNCLGALISIAVLAQASPLAARDFPHQVEVIMIEKLNHNIHRIRMRPKDPAKFSFGPGQHIYLKAPDDYLKDYNTRYKTDHEEVSRPYSFASSPGTRAHFDLIIKHYGTPPGKDVPPGVVSTYVHKHLRVGDVVAISEPGGDLYEKNDADRPIVVLAGGVGASPFVGLLNFWFENNVNEKRKIYFFLGVRARRDLLLHDQFTKWSKTKKNFHYIPALSKPLDDDIWAGETGYINQVFSRHFKENIDADAYLAGSPIMVREAIKSLVAKGVDRDNIHRDRIRVR